MKWSPLNIDKVQTREIPSEKVRGLLKLEQVKKYKAIPIDEKDGEIRIAMVDPWNLEIQDTLCHILKKRIIPQFIENDTFETWIKHYYGEAVIPQKHSHGQNFEKQSSIKTSFQIQEAPAQTTAHSFEFESGSPQVGFAVTHVQRILKKAIARRASDVHLESFEKRFRVRYRIDGILHADEDLPFYLRLAIISHMKLMAHMSITEKRLPQDGSMTFKVNEKSYDLRISTLPGIYGESLVIRILDKENLARSLEDLGMGKRELETFRQLITLPYGMVLVTGPTGSGKSTTLYAALHYLNQSQKKIITVEDPVEYKIKGINQVSVKSSVGMTFGSSLRSMLRQSPDIIMIGEIRDAETAQVAMNASLTGHLVLSTLHTHNAISAVTRLLNIGIEPFVVKSGLKGIIAQRLLRRLCQTCLGQRCSACDNIGYCGRLGIFEILLVNENNWDIITDVKHLSSNTLKKGFHSRSPLSYERPSDTFDSLNYRTLYETGLEKVSAGETSLDELMTTVFKHKH